MVVFLATAEYIITHVVRKTAFSHEYLNARCNILSKPMSIDIEPSSMLGMYVTKYVIHFTLDENIPGI